LILSFARNGFLWSYLYFSLLLLLPLVMLDD